jgi:hypothetical protein
LKLLFIDIETTPVKSYTWGLFNQNISVDQVIEPHSILCFAAKWHGSKEVMFYNSPKREGSFFERMIARAHSLLSEADAVCHFNGQSFDMPRLRTQFVKLGLPPTPPVAPIDLKKVVMSRFDMTSSKLAFVGPYLEIGAKIEHEGWPLWIGCMENKRESWEKMRKYNIQDVLLLEKLYKRVLPWIDGHPNMNLWAPDTAPRCPNCQSDKLEKRGYKRTITQIYQQYCCKNCGHWCRGRTKLPGTTAPSVR